MISEKGLCKVLKAAYKSGYRILTAERSIMLDGRLWACACDVDSLPKKAALQIVDNVGYLPVEPVSVRAGEGNQMLLDEFAETKKEMLRLFESDYGEKMKKLPVIFKERWQLYQAEQGEVYGFDVKLLELIDFEHSAPAEYISGSGRAGIWTYCGTTVLLAPGAFSGEDYEKLRHIAALDWAGQQVHTDEPENESLFDDETAPPIETEG